MSEQLHPGLHPDADALNAFIEGALPEHERLRCLAHLAECPRCREVVFLAQGSPPALAVSRPVRPWRHWFALAPALAAAAVACIAVLAVWLYSRHTLEAPAGSVVARVRSAPTTPGLPPAPNLRTEPPAPKPAQTPPETNKAVARPVPKAVPPAPRVTVSAAIQETIPPSLPAPPSVSAPAGATENARAAIPPAVPPATPAPLPNSARTELTQERAAAVPSGISGTVTDPTGAAIPGASVQVRQLDGTLSANARTDVTGQFRVAELPAGRYELQIGAPGFRQASRQIDIPPREVASIQSQLEVGSAAETVEVTAAPATLETESASVSRKPSRKKALPEEPRPLPSKLPPDLTVTSGKIMLAVDSAGAVFVSRNSGKGWKTVKPVWPGRVQSIAQAELNPAKAFFELTTESGAIWLSRDGAHWYPAPSQH